MPMTAIDTEPLAWDPLNEKYKADPHAIWKRLRDEAPVYYNEDLDFYAVSRFADVDAFSRDPKTFLSSHGTVLEIITADRIDIEMMIFMDPPEHTRYRRLVSKAFTPRRMTLLEEDIRALCIRLLDGLAGRDSFDYVQDFGARVPAYVIAALLGVDQADRDMFRGWIDESFHLDPELGMSNDVSAEAMGKMMGYVGEVLRDRKKNPRDDMFTDLLAMEITEEDGEVRRLTMEQAANFALLIGSAGTETVARLLGWAALTLDNNPDQRTELANDFELIPNAVEELLRYEAPSPVQARWCTADVEVHGQTIPANSKVIMITGSAGRDDRAFPEADRFDIHRKIDHHVSFGYGIHFCLGAALARTEARIALEETFKRYPEWSVNLDEAVPLYTSTVRGYSKLPISV
jgi:cytochrome P450